MGTRLSLLLPLGLLLGAVLPASTLGALAADFLTQLKQGAAEQGIPGLAVAVVDNGQVVLAEGLGTALTADGRQVPADRSTPFGLGSLSKAFTARLVRQLADEGRVNLEAPVVSVLPEFRVGDSPWANAITLRMLLDQTSGFGYTEGHRGFSTAGGVPWPTTLNHRPGAEFEYSNWNFVVLGRIAEVVGGAPFDQVLKDHLTGPWNLPSVTGPFPTGFRRYFGINVPSPGLPHPAAFRPAGYLSANAVDLGRYLELTLAEGLPAGSQVYQDGWFREAEGPVEVRWHDGMTPDFAAFVLLVPSQKKGAVLVANVNNFLGSPPLYRFLANQARIAMGWAPNPPLAPPPWPWLLGLVLAAVVAAQGVWPLWRFLRRPQPTLVVRLAASVVALGWAAFCLVGVPALFQEGFDSVAVNQPDLGLILILSALLAALGAGLTWVPRKRAG